VKRSARPLISALALAAGVAIAGVVLRAGDVNYPLAESSERILYIHSGTVASRVMLSWRTVAADVYWMRTIQHYGRDMRSRRTEGRFELLQPLLDLTTTLDPQFNIAYRFGAVFLATEPPQGPGRPDQAVALLEKGIKNNPDRWQYANDAGFVYYFKAAGDEDPQQMTRDYHVAADWFSRAADMPNAPVWLRPLAGITRAQGGDRAGAWQLLAVLSTDSEENIRNAAVRGMKQIRALNDIDQLRALVAAYHDKVHTYPSAWVDMVRGGFLRAIPADQDNVPYILDPDTHDVSINPQSPLVPLPRIPANK
jgi:hypothetical protein